MSSKWFLFYLLLTIKLPAFAQLKKKLQRTYVCHSGRYSMASCSYYNDGAEALVRISYDAKGKLVDMIVYEYDSTKGLIGYSVFSSKGVLIKKAESGFSQGGKVLPMVFNADMEYECKNLDKEYCVKCSYDNHGSIIFFEKRTADGALLEKYKYEYEYYK